MGERLTDVVQERRALAQGHVKAQIGGHQPSEMGAFDEVLEHVLTIGRAIGEGTDDGNQVRV